MSNLKVRDFETAQGDAEPEFILGDGDVPEHEWRIRVHPWSRSEENRSVMIALLDPSRKADIEDQYEYSIIVYRDEFVEGLLAVFPELTKKED